MIELTWIIFEDFCQYNFQERTLNNDAVDFKFLPRIFEAFLVADEDSKFGCRLIFCSFFEVFGILVCPARSAFVVFLLIEVLEVSFHTDLDHLLDLFISVIFGIGFSGFGI
jgi:hypothetical protein